MSSTQDVLPLPVLDAAVQPNTAVLDTTGMSIPHWIGTRLLSSPLTGTPSPIKIATAAVVSSYGLMFGAAILRVLLPAKPPNGVIAAFLGDWNTAFTFLVSYPIALAILMRDQAVLGESLALVEADGVLITSEGSLQSLYSSWTAKFRRINIAAQLLGVVMGALLATLFLETESLKNDSWVLSGGHLTLPLGPLFLWSIFCFYAVLSIYAFRCIAISICLRDLVSIAEFNILPFHPDHSGGLRPVGRIGLRNQYLLSALGVNLILWMAFNQNSHGFLAHLLIIGLSVVYVLLGPIVFLGPLLPFREGMLRNKAVLMSEVAQRLRRELRRLHHQLKDGEITQQDEELIDRLRKVGGVIDELPVWPYDVGTARKFLSAYLTPAAGIVLSIAKHFLPDLAKLH